MRRRKTFRFVARREAGRRSVRRYLTAMEVLPRRLPARRELDRRWPEIQRHLRSLEALCSLGEAARPHRRRRNRAERAHQVHCTLVALEQAADAAMAVVVAHTTTLTGVAVSEADAVVSEVDSALAALSGALDELAAISRSVLGQM